MGLSRLGLYIEQSDERNYDGILKEESVVGLSTQKDIIKTKADLQGVNLTSYKLFPPMSFAYVPDTSRRGDKVARQVSKCLIRGIFSCILTGLNLIVTLVSILGDRPEKHLTGKICAILR